MGNIFFIYVYIKVMSYTEEEQLLRRLKQIRDNRAEPYSNLYPVRDSQKFNHYMELVTQSKAPWNSLINTRTATRSVINNNSDRVQFERMSNEDLLELYGDEDVKKILRREGLIGNDAELLRVENDRPMVVDDLLTSVVDENISNRINQLNIFDLKKN